MSGLSLHCLDLDLVGSVQTLPCAEHVCILSSVLSMYVFCPDSAVLSMYVFCPDSAVLSMYVLCPDSALC